MTHFVKIILSALILIFSFQAFSYEKNKIESYVESLFRYKDGNFNLWQVEDSPYYCLTNLKDSDSLEVLNHAKNQILLNTPIDIKDCLYWEDKQATRNKSSIVILLYDDFSGINENETIKKIFNSFGRSEKISDRKIASLNEGNGGIYTYHTKEEGGEFPKAAVVLQKLPENGDITVRELLNKSSRFFYHADSTR